VLPFSQEEHAAKGWSRLRHIDRLLTTALIVLICSAAGAADAPPPKVVVYSGGTLIDVASGVARPDTAVVIQKDRIVAVSPGFEARDGQEVVDVRGKFIIPGLVNTHVHLATSADPKAAQAYLRREFFSGVTMVRDMAGDVRLLSELKREAEFDEILSPDIFYVALMAGPQFFVDPRTHDAARGLTPGEVSWMRAITPETDLRIAVAEAKGSGATAIKIYADVPAALVRKIVAEAHRQHLLVWAHAAVFPAIPSEVVDAGVDVISHACILGYEISKPPLQSFEDKRPVDAEQLMRPNSQITALLEAIKRRGTILDATLFAYEVSEAHSCSAAVSDHLAAEAYQAGVAISAGTDDDADWSDPDSALDQELTLLVRKAGMTPADALRSATLVGARAAGQEKDAGTVEVGKLANFVVLERNPLDDIGNVRSVSIIVKHGMRHARIEYKPVSAEEMKTTGK